MVAGQPVWVQSPARYKPAMDVACARRQRSTPGSGENVAAASLELTADDLAAIAAAAPADAIAGERYPERLARAAGK